MTRRLAIAILVSAAAALLAVPTDAQVTTGTIVGTVKDNTGAVVPGATVTVTETGKQTSSTYVTDSRGSYTAPFLIPGTYEVSVDVQGFRKHVRRGVVLQVNQRARVDVALELGTFAEATEVTALAPLTRSDSAEMGEVIEERAVRELPLNGRNFATLVYLAPGVTAGQVGENLSGASTFNPRGASNFNALGSQANANAWLIDGIDNNEYTFNTVIVTPSVESVREFKVLTGTFSAEFGRGAGVVSVSTKSGNNEFHGTAFEYLRNEKFDARNFFAAAAPAKKPPARPSPVRGRRCPGRSSATRPSSSSTTRACGRPRPDLREHGAHRQSRASATSATTVTRAANLIPIYDPLTTQPNPNGAGLIRDPFPGNVIPANRLDQVGLNVASIYPLPNGTGNFDNYTSTVNRTVRDRNFTGRLDHKATRRTAFSAATATTASVSTRPRVRPRAACRRPTSRHRASTSGRSWPGIQNTRLKTHGGAVNWTRILGPTAVNEFRFGFAKTNPETRQSDFGINAAREPGNPGHQRQRIHDRPAQPEHRRTSPASPAGPAFLPVNPKQTHYQFEDSVAWLTGPPSPEDGLPLHPAQALSLHQHRHARQYRHRPEPDQQSAANSGGSGLATLAPRIHHGRLPRLPPRAVRHDQLRALPLHPGRLEDRPSLTVNLGTALRDLRAGHREERPSRQLRSRRQYARVCRRGRRHAARQQGDRSDNLAPRLGLAWDVTGDARNVVRGGYGKSFFPLPQSASNLLGIQVPYMISQNYTRGDQPRPTSRDRCPGCRTPSRRSRRSSPGPRPN